MFNYVWLTYIIEYSSTVNRDDTGLDFLPQKLDNGYSYRFDFFTNQCRFIPRCVFSLTAAAPTLASWFYLCSLFLSPNWRGTPELKSPMSAGQYTGVVCWTLQLKAFLAWLGVWFIVF